MLGRKTGSDTDAAHGGSAHQAEEFVLLSLSRTVVFKSLQRMDYNRRKLKAGRLVRRVSQ